MSTLEPANTPALNDTLPEVQALTPEIEAKVANLAASINFADPSLSITYGAETMTEIARFADGLLAKVRAKDAGPVGQTLTGLMGHLNEVDVTALAGHEPGMLERLPVIGSLFSTAERTLARFSTLAEQVDTVATTLDATMQGLMVDIEVLEQLYQHNKAFYNDLTLAIAAGKQRLEEARTQELPRLKQEADNTGDTMLAQQVRDFAERVNRFERRIHDLEISRTVTVQTAPQIRLMQSNNQTLAEKIQTSVLTTIPIWKSQMVLALSLHGQRGAAALQRKVADTTNELLRKNSAMLEEATISTAREAERPVVDMETLRETHKRLIFSIEETLRISQEGSEKRHAAEQELQEMERTLRERLTSLAAAKTEATIAMASGTQDAIDK